MHKDLFILVKRVSDRVSLAAPTRRAFECESRSVSFNYSVVFCLFFCFVFLSSSWGRTFDWFAASRDTFEFLECFSRTV